MGHLLVFCAGVALVVLTTQNGTGFKAPPNTLLVPPTQIKNFTLGYNEALADSLWIRVIQDLDTCGHAATGLSSSPTTIPDTVMSDLGGPRVGKCEISYPYKMIDVITELAPKFRVAYSSGATMLSVIVDDVAGATNIFDKATRAFPADWQIEYQAAYHYLYEQRDRTRAADLLKAAGEHGAPKWVTVLAARLYSKVGQAQLGKAVIDAFIKENPDQAEKPHVKERLAEIEMDLRSEEHKPRK